MRPFELQRAWPIAGLILALGCQSDHLLDPANPPSVPSPARGFIMQGAPQ